MTNQLQKLKTTNRNGTKFDTPRTNNLSYKKFIAENLAALRFSKLFDSRIVLFFSGAEVGPIRKVFRQIGACGFYLKSVVRRCRAKKAYQFLQERFLFLKFLVSLFSFSEIKFQELKKYGKTNDGRRYLGIIKRQT